MESTLERTLIIFKPDALQRGIVGEILSRFEKVGLKIVGMKMLTPDRSHLHHHYETIGTLKTRKGDEIFEMTLKAMLDAPLIAVVLEGVEAAEVVRKMVGPTEPKSSAPGTIRADYAHMSYNRSNQLKQAIPNVIHASGDAKEAHQEIAHWFRNDELFDYKTLHQIYTHGE